jgi:hypothetical protein
MREGILIDYPQIQAKDNDDEERHVKVRFDEEGRRDVHGSSSVAGGSVCRDDALLAKEGETGDEKNGNLRDGVARGKRVHG